MPIHEWSHKPPGLFHHFHQRWAVSICDALNAGHLPQGFYALLDQRAADAPPKTRFTSQASDEDIYAAKADRIAIYHPMGDVVAIIEIASPGNKHSRHAIRSFVEKTVDFLGQGVHVLIIDLFPPSARDSQGIHKVIWDEIWEEPFELPPDKPLTLAAYSAGIPKKSFVEPVAVGDPLPDMPVFLDSATYILAPLEPTYLATWETCPQPLRELISGADE